MAGSNARIECQSRNYAEGEIRQLSEARKSQTENEYAKAVGRKTLAQFTAGPDSLISAKMILSRLEPLIQEVRDNPDLSQGFVEAIQEVIASRKLHDLATGYSKYWV